MEIIKNVTNDITLGAFPTRTAAALVFMRRDYCHVCVHLMISKYLVESRDQPELKKGEYYQTYDYGFW